MRLYLHYLIDFFRAHFDGKKYLVLFLFISAITGVNYWLDLEDSYLDFIGNPILKLIAFILFHTLPYLFCVYLFSREAFKDKNFWISALAGFLVLGLYRTFNFNEEISSFFDLSVKRYVFKSATYVTDIFIVIIPLLIWYLIFDRKKLNHFYGLTSKNIRLDIYIWALLLMAGVIYISSYFNSISSYYPVINRSDYQQVSAFYHMEHWQTILIFEFLYLSSFLIVELFFRGFLIFKMKQYIGNHAVVAMSVTYGVLHFGKPWPETISSFVGGYILGIWAIKSNNIWGGVVIHMGIAGLMELITYFQN